MKCTYVLRDNGMIEFIIRTQHVRITGGNKHSPIKDKHISSGPSETNSFPFLPVKQCDKQNSPYIYTVFITFVCNIKNTQQGSEERF